MPRAAAEAWSSGSGSRPSCEYDEWTCTAPMVVMTGSAPGLTVQVAAAGRRGRHDGAKLTAVEPVGGLPQEGLRVVQPEDFVAIAGAPEEQEPRQGAEAAGLAGGEIEPGGGVV